MKGIDKVPGKDLDEYPPAMFAEGGAGASVRAIDQFVKNQLDAIDINQPSSIIQQQIMDLQSQLRTLQQNGLPLYPSQGATVDLWQRSLNRIKK